MAVDKARDLAKKILPSLKDEQCDIGDIYRYTIGTTERDFSGFLSIIKMGRNEVEIRGAAGYKFSMVDREHRNQSIGRRAMLFKIESDEDVNKVAQTFVKVFLEIYE